MVSREYEKPSTKSEQRRYTCCSTWTLVFGTVGADLEPYVDTPNAFYVVGWSTRVVIENLKHWIKSACISRNRLDCPLPDMVFKVFDLAFGPGGSCRTHTADRLAPHLVLPPPLIVPICRDLHSKLSYRLCQVGIHIACSSWSTSRCASNGQGHAKEEQAGVLEDKAARQFAPGVNVAEWDRLEGRDLFRKFHSLLAERYPL